MVTKAVKHHVQRELERELKDQHDKNIDKNIHSRKSANNPVSRITNKSTESTVNSPLVGTIGHQKPSNVDEMRPITHKIRTKHIKKKKNNQLITYLRNLSPTTKLMCIIFFIGIVKKYIENNIENNIEKKFQKRAYRRY